MLLRTLYLLGRLKEAVLKMYLFKTEATKNINFSNTTNVFFETRYYKYICWKHAATNVFVGNRPLQMYLLGRECEVRRSSAWPRLMPPECL